ncbi:hypothetical protein [Patulibacter minatonensis]|uniref:hypothetical protein n=1 Tax=Patulibacter minatonensis TaxID=298163 RepID=UPI00047D9AE2|nr:hypothetical protein [Patulibacter minatonensis]
MWWSTSLSERPVGTPRTGTGEAEQQPGFDQTEALLLELDLSPVAGIWSDAVQTVGIVRSAAGLFVGWLDVGWLTPEDPFSEMRDVAHIVERVPLDQLERDLRFAISEAENVRADHLRECERCCEHFVPGQMYGAACCHSCAVRDGDIAC